MAAGRCFYQDRDRARITPAVAPPQCGSRRRVARRVPRQHCPVISRRKTRCRRQFVAFLDSVALVIERPPGTHYVLSYRHGGFGRSRWRSAAVTLDDKYVARRGPGLSDRHPGAGAPADDAAPARRGRRAQHRLLHLRLSRLAAGRVRPGAVGRAPLYREEPHPLPAGDQRGARRDRGLGQPAARPLPRRQIRRRLRHVVRQGAGRRPQRRRVQARQLRRLGAAWRRAGCWPATTTPANPRPWRTSPNIAFIDASIPVLNPAGVQEILDLGLYGWAMSRYSGCWVAFKTIAETVDSSASVDDRPGPRRDRAARGFRDAAGRAQHPLARPRRSTRNTGCTNTSSTRRCAFARANRLDRIVIDSPQPRFGIVTTGKSYLDVRQALDDLGIDEARCRRDRHPPLQGGDALAARAARASAISPRGSKRSWSSRKSARSSKTSSRSSSTTGASDVRPRVIGKFDENRRLDPAVERRADAGADRPGRSPSASPASTPRRASPSGSPCSKRRSASSAATSCRSPRTPYFCSGCPHNTSTKVPEGSRALAGIGCHYLSQFMDRSTATFTQMGGEGVPWIGQAPFTETPHVFANLGDGTYTHSGILAIRAAVAAKVNMTYKMLFNDAVAMTGGQPLDGGLTVPQSSTRQLAAEGVGPDRRRHRRARQISAGRRFRRRRRRCAIATSSTRCSASCARSRASPRSSTTRPAPPRSAAAASAAASPTRPSASSSTSWSARAAAIARRPRTACRWSPVETEFGRKRAIDQSSCNKDYSCVKGFCPSFVTVDGGGLKKRRAGFGELGSAKTGCLPLPEPAHPGARRALRHPRHRRRRHRRRHDRRPARHGRASRRQGRHRARHDRARAEGRRGL